MTWTRLSDDFTDRPEILRVSRSARLLHIEAMVWCNRMGQDGQIPTAALRRITDAEDINSDLDELARAGLWQAVPGKPDTWQLDWSDQELAEDVRARQEYRAQTQKRYRDRKAKHARGDHSMCDPRHCRDASVTGNATGNKHAHETPSRPVPSRPLGRDRDQDAGDGSAGAPPPPLSGAGRLVLDHEREQLPNPTPWDVLVQAKPVDGDHVEISLEPFLPRGAHTNGRTWSRHQFDDGFAWIAHHATRIHAALATEAAGLTARHHCRAPDNCGAHVDPDPIEPLLTVVVPTTLGAEWTDRVAQTFRQGVAA